ncbi:MAG: hypothetical protein WBC90_16745 [Albidovulum sp.]
MWAINSVTNNTSPTQNVAFSDGQTIGAVRGPEGASFRLIVNGFGYLDFTDVGHQPGGPHYWQIVIGNGIYWYDGQGAIDLTIGNDGSYEITGDGNNLNGRLTTFPAVSATDIAIFKQMVVDKYIPYQDIPDEPGKTTAQLTALGLQYFPFSPDSFELAMSIYDWTTADFTRIDFMRLFAYTGVAGVPLDMNSIANSIWSADWPPYTPQNSDYMNSFMMVPADTLADVQAQLVAKAPALASGVASECDVVLAALRAMPRTTTYSIPKLYSGQVAISNLGLSHFATYFLELPANSDTSLPPLEMPLNDALQSFLAVGKTVTLKSFMSFTDSQQDAMHYSNGIVLIVSPPDGSILWQNATYITPLSDGPEKVEYLFEPNTKFAVQKINTLVESGKTLTELYLQVLS